MVGDCLKRPIPSLITMKKPIVYGIPNCDSVKKARTWLSEQGMDHRLPIETAESCQAHRG